MDFGSSPRWRGTPRRPRVPGALSRFIPALAGNADLVLARVPKLMVHPRAGGERGDAEGALRARGGSSPRWRGTHAAGRRARAAGRFIPALAGNARASRSGSRPCPVHPRAGGERSRPTAHHGIPDGSSPRWRGTPPGAAPPPASCRFIPALAGNAMRPPSVSPSRTVHPRAGGERYLQSAALGQGRGSSPRWRGTQLGRPAGRLRGRFIPALAGNATTARRRRCQPPVHPRAGGERATPQSGHRSSVGSSPRWRGTPWKTRTIPDLHRFIPALAGNAIPRMA